MPGLRRPQSARDPAGREVREGEPQGNDRHDPEVRRRILVDRFTGGNVFISDQDDAFNTDPNNTMSGGIFKVSLETFDVVINGGQVDRLPHTTNVGFPGLDRQALLMALDMAGIACSAGSACASGSSEPSPVLLAMALPDDVIRGSLRFSIGAFTTAVEIEEAVRRISLVVKDLQRRK